MSAPPCIGVIGAGAWGTALAQLAAADGAQVRLWARKPELAEAINTAHENARFLPGVALSPQVEATTDLGWVAQAQVNLVVTPAQHVRAVLAQLPDHGQPLILCAKGIEAGTHKFMHEVAREVVPRAPLAILSGPTFAHEVAAGQPTAVTLAAQDEDLARVLAELIARPTLRPYISTDVMGAEIGGSVKNVLAIACGVVEGAGLGQNARAALIARGFAEMTRFGMVMGARAETLAGLSGLGDLVLTCSSTSSRNYSLGRGLGEGQRAAALMADRHTVAEGAFTAPVLRDVAHARGIEMPIVEAVCSLLEGTQSVDDVTEALLARPLKAE